MPSLEAEYLLRLARVGSVVLALSVAGFFVLRAQRRAPPPPPVDEGIPVILLENATIAENPEEIERAPDFAGTSDSGADENRDVLGGKPLVAPTVPVDLPREKPELPPVPAFPAEPVQLSGLPASGSTGL